MMKNQSRSKEEGSQEDEGGYDSDIARQLQERHAKLVQGKRPNRNEVKPVNLKAKSNVYNPPAGIKKDKNSFANFRKNQTAKVSAEVIELESSHNEYHAKKSRDRGRDSRRETTREDAGWCIQPLKAIRE